MKLISDPRWLAAAGAAGYVMNRAHPLMDWVRLKTTGRVAVFGDVMLAVFDKIGPLLGPYVEINPQSNDDDETPVNTGYHEFGIKTGRCTVTPGPATSTVKIDGKRIVSCYSVEEKGAYLIKRLTLTCHVRHFEWLKSWVSTVYSEWMDAKKQCLEVYAPQLNYWSKAGSRPYRPIDSIEHPDLAPRVIVKTIHDWHEHERETADRGDNFHIGFLLYGPPGTGKTSTAIAVASELRRKLYVLDPHSVKDYGGRNMGEVSGGVLLVEECDEIFPARGNGHDDIKTSVLLSTFDGPFSPWDVVRIYTTNHIDKLDPSFLRAGRVDHKFEFPPRGDKA